VGRSATSGVVRVRLFARYAELVGGEETTVSLSLPASVGDVVARVRALPGGSEIPEHPLVAVNLRQARLDALVGAGDEVALLPPVSGG